MGHNSRWTTEDIPDLTGKTAIVTGANSGLGFETTRALAGHGAEVIMACRDLKKGQRALDEVSREHPEATLTLAELDLSSLASVEHFAEAFAEEHEALHLLINNAGIMAPPARWETKDGFEVQLGTNHLGHFALTGRLLGLLLATPGSRVVTVSSVAHRQGKINFDDLQWEKSYATFAAYGQSKLANLLFTYELQRRLAAKGVETIAVAAHPGWTATNLQSHSKVFGFLNPFLGQSPPMGALPSLRAATDAAVRGGEYYGPGSLGEVRGYPKKVASNARSQDQHVAARLWDVSKELTGVTFEEL